ncbi:RNA-binding protein [Malonomonas rubra]|uniref:RNA recognition motif domain-containing protein n=1 Tax=Malonomonas rubra TaxID=57040 RepID=UPI0026EE844C|nr:RNA-binding protein [Malonomonas rubra]
MKNKAKSKDIYVADISFDAGEEDLRKLFSVCGTVKSVQLLKDKRSGLFSGRAFVRMANETEAKNAVNTLDGALLINRCIRASLARDKPPLQTAEARPEPPQRNKTRRRR